MTSYYGPYAEVAFAIETGLKAIADAITSKDRTEVVYNINIEGTGYSADTIAGKIDEINQSREINKRIRR